MYLYLDAHGLSDCNFHNVQHRHLLTDARRVKGLTHQNSCSPMVLSRWARNALKVAGANFGTAAVVFVAEVLHTHDGHH